jgi:hypothetical protein
MIFNLLRKYKHGEASTVKPLKIIFYREFENEDDLEEVRLIFY